MYYLIVNPISGSGRALKIEKQVVEYMKAEGIDFHLLRTSAPGHGAELAAEAAARSDCTAVIALGGDGLAYEVACGLAGTNVPLGIIPGGTGNDFIKTAGTPKDPMEALKFILNGTPRPTDFGVMNHSHFLNVCGTGFDVTVLDEAESVKKYARGLLPYLIGLIKAIFHYKPVHVRIQADDQLIEKDVLICAVANGRYIGGGIPICPDACLDDGLLNLVIIENVPRRMIPRYLPGLLSGKILSYDFTTQLKCKNITIDSPGMRLECDGEITTLDSVTFSVLPGKLSFYRP